TADAVGFENSSADAGERDGVGGQDNVDRFDGARCVDYVGDGSELAGIGLGLHRENSERHAVESKLTAVIAENAAALFARIRIREKVHGNFRDGRYAIAPEDLAGDCAAAAETKGHNGLGSFA